MGNSKSSQAASAADKALAKLFSRPSALSPEQFALAAVGHHGALSNAKVIAFCGLQGLLAVGTSSGAVKVYGKDELEMLLDIAPPLAMHTNLPLGVAFLKFTARQRLVVTYSDSSIRVLHLAEPGCVHAELRGRYEL